MKFRKEYQKYLLIILAIVATSYFLKPLFFNKKKKVVEGIIDQGYYRVDINLTDLKNKLETTTDEIADKDILLQILLLTQYNQDFITNGNSFKYISIDNLKQIIIQSAADEEEMSSKLTNVMIIEEIKKFFTLIDLTNVLLYEDATETVVGVKVVKKPDLLDFFGDLANKMANKMMIPNPLTKPSIDMKEAFMTAFIYTKTILLLKPKFEQDQTEINDLINVAGMLFMPLIKRDSVFIDYDNDNNAVIIAKEAANGMIALINNSPNVNFSSDAVEIIKNIAEAVKLALNSEQNSIFIEQQIIQKPITNENYELLNNVFIYAGGLIYKEIHRLLKIENANTINFEFTATA